MKPNCTLALAALSLLGVSAPGVSPAQEPTFIRGDANMDGRVSMADAVMVRRYVFNGKAAPPCLDAADSDDSGRINLTDSIRILLNFFPNQIADWGTTSIPDPFPGAGVDATEDALECASSGVEPAEQTEDIVRIGTVEAGPGEEVSIPVFLTNTVDVDAIQLVIHYDPSLFTPHSGSLDDDLSFDVSDTFYEILIESQVEWFASVQAHPEDGLITIGIVGSVVREGFEVPPGNETLLFRFRGTVSPNAQPGSEIFLEPTGGPDGQGVKPPLMMRNELTHRGESRFVVTLPRTVPGLIGIVDDVTFFIRGDSNGDLVVNIGDPVFTLSHLFLAGSAPECPDAADADDNGTLELSDAVVTLTYLFHGSNLLPPPLSVPGGDPTPDTLPRCRR